MAGVEGAGWKFGWLGWGGWGGALDSISILPASAFSKIGTSSSVNVSHSPSLSSSLPATPAVEEEAKVKLGFDARNLSSISLTIAILNGIACCCASALESWFVSGTERGERGRGEGGREKGRGGGGQGGRREGDGESRREGDGERQKGTEAEKGS